MHLVAVLVQRGRVGLHGGGRVEHDGQALVLRHDALGGVLGDVGILGGHDGDRLADVAHRAVGQHGLEEAVERAVERAQPHGDARHRVEVGGGQDGDHAGHARAPPPCRCPSSRPWATVERTTRIQSCPGRSTSSTKRPPPREQAGVLDAPQRAPDRRHPGCGSPSAAARTAARIDW